MNPYLVLDTIHELIEEEMLDKAYYAAVEDYTLAILRNREDFIQDGNS